MTKPKPVSELTNLVYGYTDIPHDAHAGEKRWYLKPVALAVIVVDLPDRV